MWAKTDRETSAVYGLAEHLLDTAAAAQVLYDHWLRPHLRALIADAVAGGDERAARRVVMAVAGLHDVGKANPLFQSQARATRRMGVVERQAQAMRNAGYPMDLPRDLLTSDITRAHETVTMAALGSFPQDTEEAIAGRWAGAAAGGHHGMFRPQPDVGSEDSRGDSANDCALLHKLVGMPKWEQAQRDIIELVMAATGTSAAEMNRPLQGRATEAFVLISGLVMVADWIASDDWRAGEDWRTRRNARAYIVERARHFKKTVNSTLGLYSNPSRSAALRHADVMGVRDPYGLLYPLQSAALSVGDGLWIATETTGSGKTEAAMLRHMQVGESVTWALPTRATADAMFLRVRRMYGRGRNVGALLHAHRSLNGWYTGDDGDGRGLRRSGWSDVLGNLKSLMAPVTVGTIDQVLMGVLAQKWTAARMLAIANSHVIIDEAHLMDEYQIGLAEQLLAWCGRVGARTTVLSATMPTDYIQRLGSAYAGTSIDVGDYTYPGHLHVEVGGRAHGEQVPSARSYLLDVEVRHQLYIPEADLSAPVARAMLDVVRELRAKYPTSRIGVVANRVDTAIGVGDQLLREGAVDVTLLHSRMSAGHRTALSTRIEDIAGKRSRAEGSIIIGTQTLESSLDLDFDIVVTELAPAAALLQRAGRLWRSTQVTGDVWATPWHERPTKRPRLVVVSMHDAKGQIPEQTYLPYSRGGLGRTLEVLTANGGSLRIPEDVQGFVDAAHYSIPKDVAEEEIIDHREDLDARAMRDRAAARFVIPVHELMSRELTFAGAASLTGHDELDESTTRYPGDYRHVTVLLVDEASRSRWAWRGRLDKHARVLATRRPREVSELLSMTVRVPEGWVFGKRAVLEPLCDRDPENSPFKAAELRGVIPVTVIPGATVYDEVLGMVRLRR